MTSILDDFPYPWHKPEAQELHRTLCQLHPTPQGAVLMAQQAGADASMIDAGQPPFFVWKDILEQTGTMGVTRQLVQIVQDKLSPSSPRRPFFIELLANRVSPTDGERRGGQGEPNFLRDSDDISEPEALLYYDDLTIQIGRVPGLIETLQKLLHLAPSVCRLSVDFHGAGQQGTGFRIGSDLLLTNWHVFYNSQTGVRASAVTAEFGYEHDSQGQALAPSVVKCDTTTIVADQTDDWAIIRVAEPLKNTWPIVSLSDAVVPEKGTAAFIIQHPGGDRKRIGFVRNTITSFDDRIVHYLTDTQEGASGAPVFNALGQLVALHHAGGRPQQLVGKPPVKKNEGIRISRVVEGLKSQGVNVS